MMDIMPALAQNMSLIESYGEGGVTISQKRYDGAILVLPETVIALDDGEWDALDAAALIAIIQEHTDNTELVLFGSGAHMKRLSEPFKAAFRAENMATDAMDTGAACRTFSVLLSESRAVAAVLLAV